MQGRNPTKKPTQDIQSGSLIKKSNKKSKYPAPRAISWRIEVLYSGCSHETDENPTACTFLARKLDLKINSIRLELVSPSQKTEQNQYKTKEGGRDWKRWPVGRQLVHRALSLHFSVRNESLKPSSSKHLFESVDRTFVPGREISVSGSVQALLRCRHHRYVQRLERIHESARRES